MVNYQNGKIYKIYGLTHDLEYYGSTVRTLSSRLGSHTAEYRNWLKHEKKTNGTTSYLLFKTGDYKIMLVEKYPCNTKEELHSREAYYIKNNNCVNKFIPCRKGKEYYEDNKEKIKEKTKKYYKKNIEKVKIRQKELILCECGYQYTRTNKSRHMKQKNHLLNT